ncbi:MAG: hypothetical protein F6K35_10365, partial [Okeania sp. SIO2H7]|nr:hypothetical protein [Okeania sp. SIO2H7]
MGRWGDGEMERWGDGEMGRQIFTFSSVSLVQDGGNNYSTSPVSMSLKPNSVAAKVWLSSSTTVTV